ncbi:unnamed protein product [Musa acuminata subsp. malaccensis]|uniref:(wild Malaysian banana) hypothetical protein n=1 Tax=Musa acuminata subsp. malaccensis TaxID=214687 RepID=A0A804HPB3_MUSAM|nr:unnamed protein product [Musa acuminata subsp. malaccensis]
MEDGCFLKRRREKMNEEEEKGAQRRGARRQSAFIFFESHRPVRSYSTRKQRWRYLCWCWLDGWITATLINMKAAARLQNKRGKIITKTIVSELHFTKDINATNLFCDLIFFMQIY